ncbi:hypothetical protein V1525DRAFT_424474 [Lipomyces kononenkoae]|uniref:Uncharacterized protein n=1 Tax=Lipomyces kononenkoae TaxID=34357 RepID=A0ACC3T820_LIPKO
MASQKSSYEDPSTAPEIFSAYAVQLQSGIEELRQEIERINSSERNYVALQDTLETYSHALTREAIVRIGPRALVKAQVVHTNEIYTAVGDGYIIQQSAYHASQMAGRRAECMN